MVSSTKVVDSNPAGRRELLESIAGYRRVEIAPGGLRMIAAIHDRRDYIKKRRAGLFCRIERRRSARGLSTTHEGFMRPRRIAVIAAHSRSYPRHALITPYRTALHSCFMPVGRLVALQASLCQRPVGLHCTARRYGDGAASLGHSQRQIISHKPVVAFPFFFPFPFPST
jgi:hypothetical protein